MDTLRPDRFPLSRTHDFLVWAVGVEYEVFIRSTSMFDFPDAPRIPKLSLLVNKEERISLLPIPLRKPILLKKPILIKAEDILNEVVGNNNGLLFMNVGYDFDADAGELRLKFPFIVKPHLVLYGYYQTKDEFHTNEKGYFLTIDIPSNETLYNLNIEKGMFEANIVDTYEFKYDGEIGRIIVYPRVHQLTSRVIGMRKVGLISVPILIHSLASYDITRLDILPREASLERIFINRYEYDSFISYQNDFLIKAIEIDKSIKAGDRIIIGLNVKNVYFRTLIPSLSATSLYDEIVFQWNEPVVFPIAINFSYRIA